MTGTPCVSKYSSVLGISKIDLTPYLLDRIKELTGGESLKTNIALVQNNALIGAQVAVAYHELNAEGRPID